MPRRKHVELLLHKAEQDERTLEILLSHDSAPVESIGFHAQQAAEKLLKAAIKALGGEYPMTHDLWRLLRQLAQAGVEVPDDVRAARELTPYAGGLRYDALPDDGSAQVDGLALLRRVRAVRVWVEDLVMQRDRGDGA